MNIKECKQNFLRTNDGFEANTNIFVFLAAVGTLKYKSLVSKIEGTIKLYSQNCFSFIAKICRFFLNNEKFLKLELQIELLFYYNIRRV